MFVSAVSVIRTILSATFAVGAVTAFYVFDSPGSTDPAAQYSAVAVNMAAPGQSQPTPVDIIVNRWSTARERDQLWNVLSQQGPDELLSTLQNTATVGYFKSPDALSYDLHYAWHSPLPDGGERVVLGTDRSIGYWELSNDARTVQYPFTIIELHLKADGRGEGKMSIATKVSADADTKTVVLENWNAVGVQLMDVREKTDARPAAGK